MDSRIISEAIHPEILGMLNQGSFEEVLSIKKERFDTGKKPNAEGYFAYEILSFCLNKTITPTAYSKLCQLDFKGGFLTELSELHRILLVLQDYSKAPEIEVLVNSTLLECIRDGAMYIERNANNYPEGAINGKIWMDGSGLRTRAYELSLYFTNKGDDANALDAIFLRGKLTNTIMGHYPNLVGPDMVAIAQQCEKMGNAEGAKRFYNPVVLDFTGLVEDVAQRLSESEAMEEDFPITESLIHALEGLKRLGEGINEECLQMSREVLKKLAKAAGG